MSEREDYRDELGAAHRRITALEQSLAEREHHVALLRRENEALKLGPPLPAAAHARYGRTVGLGLAVLAAIFGTAALGMYYGGTHEYSRPTVAPAEGIAYEEHVQASYYPQPGIAPIVTQVDEEKTEDLIWLFWDSHHDQTAVHVAALSGISQRPIWSSKGYPSQWYSDRTHLMLQDGFVVLSDSKDAVHVIDVATGAERRTIAFPGGAYRMCRPRGESHGIVLGREGDPDSHLFDLDTGEELHPKTPPACAIDPPPCTPKVDANVACDGYRFDLHPRTKGVVGSQTTELGEAFLVHGAKSTTVKAVRPQEWALGGDRKTGAIKWEARVAEPDDTEHFGVDRWALAPDGSQFFVAFQLDAGPFKIIARKMESGDLVFSHVLAGTAEGSRVQSISATSSRVYVVVNQELRILDRDSGKTAGSVEWIDIPLHAHPRELDVH